MQYRDDNQEIPRTLGVNVAAQGDGFAAILSMRIR
jgi:hypothetical protein